MSDTDDETPLPTGVIDRAEQLTRQARNAVDENEREAYLRERRSLLDEHDYRARIRAEDDRDILVLYPGDWVEDGTVRPARIENIDRGIERPLSGVGDGSFEAVDAHNRELVAAVEREHGPDHGANVDTLADFAGNHYKKPIEELSAAEVTLFLEEYYPRNVWPTATQQSLIEQSVRLAFKMSGTSVPIERRQ